ncbi:MAG TPA: hypothetical protein VHZ98_15975 [Galbitalea sp.]|nr:hypothetical protein [Galbitalea sp.]
MSEDPWYAERRARWRPDEVRLLLIAESAPDDGGDEANRRFFYDDNLTGRDGLFRQVVHVLFDNPELKSGPVAKAPWLAKLRDRGVYLIDLASVPVNYHSRSERAAALQQDIDATVGLAGELAPDGIVLVKRNVFDLLNEPLRAAGLRVLHDKFIPFPASGQQPLFRERFMAACRRL